MRVRGTQNSFGQLPRHLFSSFAKFNVPIKVPSRVLDFSVGIPSCTCRDGCFNQPHNRTKRGSHAANTSEADGDPNPDEIPLPITCMVRKLSRPHIVEELRYVFRVSGANRELGIELRIQSTISTSKIARSTHSTSNGRNRGGCGEEKASPILKRHLFRLFPQIHMLGVVISGCVADNRNLS